MEKKSMPAKFQALWILHTNWKSKSSSSGWVLCLLFRGWWPKKHLSRSQSLSSFCVPASADLRGTGSANSRVNSLFWWVICLLCKPTQKPYDTTMQSCRMRDRMLSSPHPETLWPNNAVMLHAWQNAIIAPPETLWPNNAVMLHAWQNAIIAPPETLWPNHAVMLHAWQNAIIAPPATLWPNNSVMLHAWQNAIIAHPKPFDPTMQSCCMRDRMLSSPHPKPFWPNNAVMLHAWQNAIIAPPETFWPNNAVMLHAWQNATIAPPETLWPNNAVMLHAWQNAIIAPPETLWPNNAVIIACVTECYHRPTQKPYDTTMQSCCMRDRMLSSPHPKPWKPHESVRPSTRPQPTTY